MKNFSLRIPLLAIFAAAAVFIGCQRSPGAGADGVIQVTVPHYRSGQNIGGRFFLPQVERFNQKYAGRYRLIIEELVQDLYGPTMQQLSLQNRLPALVDSGSPEWINEFIIPGNRFVDLRPILDNNPAMKSYLIPESIEYNTVNDGRLFSINYPFVRPIGLFYNPRLYQPSRAISQMTWDDLIAEIGNNRIAFMTSENAWTSVLTLSALIAAEPGGAAWLAAGANENPRHTDFNNPMMINAVAKLQRLLQNNASDNTMGAAYADAANSFMSMRSAIIPNGSWMIADFDPESESRWSNGFNGADVRADIYPGNIALGNPGIGYGWWIPSNATPQEQELAMAFIDFTMSPDELERFMLAEGAVAPRLELSQNFLDEVGKHRLMSEYTNALNAYTILAYTLESVIPNSVFEIDIGRILPLLITGAMTPVQFCEDLTIRAREAMR